jgi:hypothetical protein
LAVVIKPFVLPRRNKPAKTSEALDVAARYLVYKLYDAARANPALWQSVPLLGETATTVSRAVDLGWVIIRDERTGRLIERYAALTDPGRMVARKGLR